jgi:primosomal protein N' (replication factor Y)
VSSCRIVSLAIPTPLRRTFDYEVPEALAARVKAGARVRVSFGRRELTGIVLDAPRHLAQRDYDYKPVLAVLDPAPMLPEELLTTLRWAADYYHHPVGEIVAAALPTSLRRGRLPQPRRDRGLGITDAGRSALADAKWRGPARRKALEALRRGPQPRAGLGARVARDLLALGWAEEVELPESGEPALRDTPPQLTAAQLAALDAMRTPGFGVVLLQGVTGSGKTEVYLHRAAEVLGHGGQALLLVPEIGLTPQLLERARARLGDRVIAYHSGLTDLERLNAWLRIRAGEALLVVGTRSSVWLPFSRLAQVLVDEEHDASFKQQDGFRYSARDVAIVRARHHSAPVVLGSATPSLETLANAEAGRYTSVELPRPVNQPATPTLRVLDARQQRSSGGMTPALIEAVKRHVADDGQVLLFVNRRGYAAAVLCGECGWASDCRSCDARMTWHRETRRLLCHHCGAQAALPSCCPACGAHALRPAGHGTERIEEALRVALPAARIERIDSDRVSRRGSWEALRGDILARKVQVLVGTQMLAKGHDFPGLTLVGIVSVDSALYSADFRATERMGQLVTQVAGRAGRGDRAGEVLLQTHAPEHPMLRLLVSEGYPAFARALLSERQGASLPPSAPLALLRAEGVAADAAEAFLGAAAELLAAQGAEVMGPLPAPMARRAGRHRAQLWLQAASRAALQRALTAAMPGIEALPLARKVRWVVDVDPADTL